MFILRESVTYRYRTLHVHSSANSTLPHSPNLGNLRRSSNANRVHRIGELDLKSFTDLKSFPTGYVSRLPPVSFTGRYVVWPRDGGGNHRAAPSDVVSTTITMRTTHVGRARARPLAAALILDRARGCAEGARGGADGPRGGAEGARGGGPVVIRPNGDRARNERRSLAVKEAAAKTTIMVVRGFIP